MSALGLSPASAAAPALDGATIGLRVPLGPARVDHHRVAAMLLRLGRHLLMVAAALLLSTGSAAFTWHMARYQLASVRPDVARIDLDPSSGQRRLCDFSYCTRRQLLVAV